jgi:hypothetical protein
MNQGTAGALRVRTALETGNGAGQAKALKQMQAQLGQSRSSRRRSRDDGARGVRSAVPSASTKLDAAAFQVAPCSASMPATSGAILQSAAPVPMSMP